METNEQVQTPEIMETVINGVIKFNITDAAIADLKKYSALTIAGVTDKAGFKAVDEARKEVKNIRVGITKHGKKLRDAATAWNKKVLAEENRIVEELEKIETDLLSKTAEIEAERERLRIEEENRQNAIIQERLDKLAAYGFAVDYATIKVIDEDQFNTVLEDARIMFDAEQKAKELKEREELEAKQKAEAEAEKERQKIEAERKELEVLRAQQAAAQKIIDDQKAALAAEQKKLADEQAALLLAKQKAEADKKPVLTGKELLQHFVNANPGAKVIVIVDDDKGGLSLGKFGCKESEMIAMFEMAKHTVLNNMFKKSF